MITKRMKNRKCFFCGEMFIPNSSNQKRCILCRHLKCFLCKKSFIPPNSIYSTKYCSEKCYRKNSKILDNCLFCGKEFWAWKCQKKKYCSLKCDDLDRRKLLKGEKSHLWKGGVTKLNQLERSRAIYKDWRDTIFKRDNYTCQICGINSGHGKAIYLHAHHIKKFADYPENRFDTENGITLCKNCHLLEHFHKF